MSLELSSLRDAIRAVDEEILVLAARRQELAAKVAEAKLRTGKPIKDEAVEAEVIRRGKARAGELGIYEDLAAELLQTLIRHSCRLQEEWQGREKARARADKRRVAILGGAGRMGRWLHGYFQSRGHEVKVVDPAAKGGATIADAAAWAEVIAVATPLSSTAGALDEIRRVGTRALVFDIASLKGPVLPALERLAAAGVKTASLHPMFGPVPWLVGRNLLVCELGPGDGSEDAVKLFRDSPVTVARVPIGKHDALMGWVLGLSHLVNLAFGAALEKSGLTFGELRGVGSTTFSSQLEVTRPVVGENTALYFEIQAANGATPEVIGGLRAALDSYAEAIRRKDQAAFAALMDASRRYFS